MNLGDASTQRPSTGPDLNLQSLGLADNGLTVDDLLMLGNPLQFSSYELLDFEVKKRFAAPNRRPRCQPPGPTTGSAPLAARNSTFSRLLQLLEGPVRMAYF